MNENIFYAFDVEQLDFFPVIYDEINFIFFDPITEAEYDHPWVFKDLEEASTTGVEVFKEHINSEHTRLRMENHTLMFKTRKYYTLCNLATWFYIEPYTMEIRLCIKDKQTMKDANTNVILEDGIEKFSDYDQCYSALVVIAKKYEQERNDRMEQLEQLRKQHS